MINKEEITEIIRKLSYTGYTEQDIKSEAIRIIEQLKQKAELGEHYKHLYSEVKKQKDELEKEMDYVDDYNKHLLKQKDDVVEYIKNKREQLHHSFDEPDWDYLFICNPDDLLRMLGEIDENR